MIEFFQNADVAVVLFGFLSVFSLGLLAVSLLSLKKSLNKKLFFVCLVFVVFFVKAVLLTLSLFVSDIADFISIPLLSGFDVLILVLLFIATLRR